MSLKAPEDIAIKILDILRFERKPMQSHTKEREFSVISCRLKGSTDFSYRGRVIPASPASFVYIPAHVAYQQTSTEEEIICVHFVINEDLYPDITSFISRSPYLAEQFVILNRLWREKKGGSLLKCQSILYDILFHFYRIYHETQNSLLNTEALIDASMKYIHANGFQKDFSWSKAIAASHLSEAYFRRIFKTVYHVTPVMYLQTLKTDYAKALLSSRLYPLKEIADICGFTEEKYFFAVFKKITGMTPSEWTAAN